LDELAYLERVLEKGISVMRNFVLKEQKPVRDMSLYTKT
jgi:hypothetical protein